MCVCLHIYYKCFLCLGLCLVSLSICFFSGLGLENMGCITFDEKYFFVDELTSRHRAFRIARLICHEISHMWMGDLLTPPSFDEVWFIINYLL